MQNKKLIRFVESFVLMPIMTMGLPLGGLSTTALNLASNTEIQIPQVVLSQKLNTEAESSTALNQAIDMEVLTKKAKADAIDAYFRKYNMPLEGMGMKMVEESIKHNIDWRLLAAISVRESTGGKHACKSPKAPHSFFGYGGCKFGFQSKDHAVEVVARSLGGNNPRTAHYYAGKNTLEILETYNPRTIVKHYPEQVIAIMDAIGEKNMGLELAFNY